MWNVVINIIKKVSKYAAVAFTGYEIKEKLGSSEQAQIVKETTIIKENSANSSNEVIFIIFAMVTVGIIFTAITQVYKCMVNKNTNNNTANASIQLEAQIPQPAPASRRQ